jgi:hypothetical protein
MVFVIVGHERQMTRVMHNRHTENFLVPIDGFLDVANA